MGRNLTATFKDVMRREIATKGISKDGVQVLVVEEKDSAGESKQILTLNKVDAQKLKDVLDQYLKGIYASELAGLECTLSPADMIALFGEEEN